MSKKCKHDKYYTKPEIAAHCVDILRELIPAHQRQIVLEPAAGNGVFLGHFDNTIAFDLMPEAPGIKKQNFFDVSPTNFPDKSTATVLGNPPFGHASSLAIKFFNHSALLGNTIAFVIPMTFRKLSVHKRLNLNFHLLHDEELPKNSFLLHGKSYHVPCLFQVWQYREEKRVSIQPENPYFEFISKSEAGSKTFCVRRAGGKAGRLLKGLDHSEDTTYFINAKCSLCRPLFFMLWLDGSITDIVSNTVATKSISKGEMVAEMKRAIEDYHLAHGRKMEYWK